MAKTPKAVVFDDKTSAEIVDLRDNQEKKWTEIADITGVPSGKAMLIYGYAKTKPKDRIKNATGADIARLRDDEHLSWGTIIARTGYPEGSCRSLYEAATGNATKGNRIGKGGRHYLGETEPKPKKAAAGAKKVAGKKVAGTAAKARPTMDTKLKGKTPEEIAALLTKKAIEVQTGGEPETIRVKAVKKVSKGAVVLTDIDGQARTIKVASITRVSVKPVM